MLTRYTGRIATGAIAVAAGLAVLSPMAHAADPAAGPAKPAKLTVASYTKYLKTQNTPEAKQTLKKFGALNNKQKAVFLKDLQDRKIYKALLGAANGKVGKPVNITDRYNKDVSFVIKGSSFVAKDKKRTVTARFSVTEKIFNIPVTTETISISVPTAGKGPRLASAKAEVKNVNAAIKITNNRVSVKGRAAQTFWTATPQVSSFGKKPVFKKEHILAGNVTFRASLTDND